MSRSKGGKGTGEPKGARKAGARKAKRSGKPKRAGKAKRSTKPKKSSKAKRSIKAKKPGKTKSSRSPKKSTGRKKSGKPGSSRGRNRAGGRRDSVGGGRQRGGTKPGSALEQRLMERLATGPARTKELAADLRVPKDAYPQFRDSIKDLVAQGSLLKIRGGRVALPGHGSRLVGVLNVARAGYAFVRVEGEDEDVFIPKGRLDSALSGDRVAVLVVDRPPGKGPVGEVVEVIEAGRNIWVGTYEDAGEVGFVVPLDPRIHRDLLIPQGDGGGAAHGDLVVATIAHRGTRKHGPVGAVTDVLGPASDSRVRSLAVARGRGFNPTFPSALAKAVKDAAAKPLGARVDRTSEVVVTIDPADAKDHDDALSLRSLEGGVSEVGVHIADVSHYVELDGPLDLEARSRGTSVYLVDRVIPMLPEELSTDLCSLVPDAPRPVLSAILEIDDRGEVQSARFERALIQSRKKLSYEDAQAIVDRADTAGEEIDELVRGAWRVAKALRVRRMDRGSLDLDFPEAQIELDADGHPADSLERPKLESHGLIEELMLAANEAVAKACIKRRLPIPFRVHAAPSGEGLEEAVAAFRSLGYSVGDEPTSGELQAVVAEAKGTEKETLVNWLVLKALKRAEYAPENVGHFGLGATAYAHFTSPIRRYPDLILHRVVGQALIDGGSTASLPSGDELAQLCDQLSKREKEAEDAERDSILLSQIEIMLRHVGETFVGRITGITPFGAFVRIPRPFAEGLLHVSEIQSDYLEFDPGRMTLVGKRTGLRFSLGQELTIVVARVNREERKIDFSLASAPSGAKGRRGRARRK